MRSVSQFPERRKWRGESESGVGAVSMTSAIIHLVALLVLILVIGLTAPPRDQDDHPSTLAEEWGEARFLIYRIRRRVRSAWSWVLRVCGWKPRA